MEMEFYEVKLINNWYFKIKLPQADIRFLKYKIDENSFNYYLKRYVKSKVTRYLYHEEEVEGEFVFQIGFASFIYNTFSEQLLPESKRILEKVIFSDIPKLDLPNLREVDQIGDLNQLLSLNRGLFQCYTSYGKTEIISTLTKWIIERGEYLLIITPSSLSKDTIRDRLLSDRFNIDLSDFDSNSKVNLININGFFRSYKYNSSDPFWRKVKWILADEVEGCVTETIMEVLESLPNIKHVYGFSATADKKEASPIFSRVTSLVAGDDKFETVKEILGRNKFLVGYYGTTAVYRKSTEFEVTLMSVKTTFSADDLDYSSDYEYSEIIYNLYTNNRFCKLIQDIAFSVGLVYIPMPRLAVIDYWIDNYFKGDDYLVLSITSRGLQVYRNGELLDYVTLKEAEDLIRNGTIQLIVGTKSSYNAIDFGSLDKIMLLYSKAANIVMQTIGRATRPKKFTVYSIVPRKKVPVYTKDLIKRIELIESQFNECKLIKIEKDERLFKSN